MDKFAFIEGLGKRIIESHHDFFVDNDSQDLDHIGTFKRTIVTIAEYLKSEGLQEDQINTLIEYYKKISRDLFISTCISNKDYDEDEGLVKKESEIWFDYIYEHEDYPD